MATEIKNRNGYIGQLAIDLFANYTIQYLSNGCISLEIKSKDGLQKAELIIDSNREVLRIKMLNDGNPINN